MNEAIPHITGVYSNADSEDLSNKFARTLKNLISRTGKLEKTFDYGVKFQYDVLEPIDTGNWVDSDTTWEDEKFWVDDGTTVDTAIGQTITNLTTYFNENFSTPTGSGDGYAIIGLEYTANVLSLIYFDGDSWESISNMLENALPTIYHKDDVNPIIQENGILRLLPGNVGLVSAHVASGLWIGYIDRDFFDEIYQADTDYNAGFYAYEIDIEAPDIDDLSLTSSLISGGSYTADTTRYYKLSYVYDGENESFLSDQHEKTFTADTLLKASFTITLADHNKRITAINVYRSDTGQDAETAGSESGSFNKIVSIDLTRKESDYVGNSQYCYAMFRRFYITDTGTVTPSVYTGDWKIYTASQEFKLEWDGYPNSDDEFVVILHSSVSDLTVQGSNVSWELRRYNALGTIYDKVAEDTTNGCWYGDNKIIIYNPTYMQFFDDFDFGTDQYIGSLLFTNDTEIDVISATGKRVITVSDNYAANFSNKAWKILVQSKGLYYWDDNTTTVTGYFFDNDITEGDVFPLLNSPSIEVNGEYAIYHRGRLWQFNVVLDPNSKREVHKDWLTYSELDQPDINPVSNVIRIDDPLGGDGTGLAVSFGSLVLFKEHSVFKLIIPDPSDDTTWELTDSIFSRGNIAKHGLVQVGHIAYFCSYDGIYELDVNFQAAADDTPLIQNRISEPINDKYLALDDVTEKPNIIGRYDQINAEVIWQLEEGAIWAYSITNKTWREVDSAIDFDVLSYDESGNMMICDNANQKLYSTSVNGNCGCHVVTKVFPIRSGKIGETKGVLRYVKIRYKSAVALTVNVYCDDNYDTTRGTGTLSTSSTITTSGIAVRYWCNNFAVEIKDATSNGSATEIYEIGYEVD
jgi:hypothetical protein